MAGRGARMAAAGLALAGTTIGAAAIGAMGSAAHAQSGGTWSQEVASGRVDAALAPAGGEGALVVTVHPRAGVGIEPAVLRIDAPMLIRPRLRGRFPTTVRGSGHDGPLRATLRLTHPGAVRFGTADSNDGALRVEYRFCPRERTTCSVERVDIALKMGD